MLPNPALKPVYDDIVWLYVYRDFSSSAPDRAAERISLRFGVTSWPHLFLVDPNDLKVLAETGRSVPGFLAAAGRSKAKRARSLEALQTQQAAEQRADKLERRPTVKGAIKALRSDDIIERYAGLAVLMAKDPERIVAEAGALLAVPNDPFRYAVCGVLKEAAAANASSALESVVNNPKNSRNPNVLRMRAVQALATCGDAGSVAVIGKWAATGAYRNGLTGVSIDALVAIRKRIQTTRKAVNAVLAAAYPALPSGRDATDARAMRSCVALAKRVHAALGSKQPFPRVYDEAARRKLMR